MIRGSTLLQNILNTSVECVELKKSVSCGATLENTHLAIELLPDFGNPTSKILESWTESPPKSSESAMRVARARADSPSCPQREGGWRRKRTSEGEGRRMFLIPMLCGHDPLFQLMD